MKISQSITSVGVAMLLTVGLAACDKPGPAERAGKNIDQSIDMAGEKMEKAADAVGEKMDHQSEKAGVAMDDAAITTKVKAAIFAEAGLKSLQISVDTIQGVVTLSGSVDSRSSSDKARGLAGAVAGVRDVENHLVVTK